MTQLTAVCLTFSLLLAPLAGTAAEPAQTGTLPRGDTATPGRIAIRDRGFLDTGTGEAFRPVGVNYYRLGQIEEGKQRHAAFSPGSYDEVFITRMMENLSRDGFNTVRSFLSNHSGPDGIVTHVRAAEVNPAYLRNLVHFLRTAQTHGIRVILSWDSWTPDSLTWAEPPLADESRHGWVTEPGLDFNLNGFRLTPKPIRIKANAIRALIEGLRMSAPDLLPVVLAWELENEVHFNLDQEPFRSRPAAFAFGGREFDLRTDSGAQALMDTAIRSWATACADAVHVADPGALVSASVFTFNAVGRHGQGTWSKDRTKDMRVPARPLALLDTSLDFVDLHLYAGKSETESIAQFLERDLTSVEMPALADQVGRLCKPILIGESGVAAHYMRRGPDWQTIPHDAGANLLREFHQALAGFPFAGVLHWHYGSPDSTVRDEYPALVLFPQYGEALRTAWKAR